MSGALHRAWQARGAATVGFALLVLACVFLAVAGPRADLALRTRALRQALAIAAPTARSVHGSIDATGLDADLGQVPTASSISGIGNLLQSRLTAAGLPLAGDDWSGITTPDVTVTAGLPPAIMGTLHAPQLHLVYRGGMDGYGTLTAGRMPSAARVAGVHAALEVAVTQAAAARYGLHPGSVVQAGDITLTVAGVIRPAMGGAAFWTEDPELAAPRLTVPAHSPESATPPPYWAAAFFIGAAEVPAVEQLLPMPEMTVSWEFPINVGTLTADDAAPLVAVLSRTLTVSGILSYHGAAPVTLNSGIMPIIAVFTGQDNSAGTVLRLLAVSLSVIAVVTVLLGGQALARRREADQALLIARGASRGQVALGAARDAAVAAVPGATAGALLAVAAVPGSGMPLSWWLAAVTVIAAVGSGPVLALRGYPRTAGQRAHQGAGRRGAARRAVAWRRVAVEAALTVLAVASLVLLRSGAGGLFTSLAPVLAAVPAAIIVTRGYPLAAAGLARLARRRRGAAVFSGLAGAADGARGALVPVFALVLVLAVGAFGFLVRDAANNGVADASWQQAGADVTVNSQLASRTATEATVRDVSAVPGVRKVALVSLDSGSVNGIALPVAVVQPAQYAALAAGTPLPPFPAAALAGPGADGTVPALVTPAGVTALAAIPGLGGVGASTRLTVGLKPLSMRIVGEISPLPGIADSSGSTTVLGGGTSSYAPDAPDLILPAWALGPGADGAGPADGPGAALAPPGFLLVTGTDSPELMSVIGRELPGLPSDAITRRAVITAALGQAPLAHGEYLAVVSATAAAAVLAALALLIAIAGGARSRLATVARLRVMGLPASRGWLVELTQTLPLVIAAAVGGVACAWALGPLAGPALNLSAFTGTAATVPVTARWAPLGAAVAALIVLATAALAATTVVAGKEEDPA
jgi:putative ABC transport system permease protein